MGLLDTLGQISGTNPLTGLPSIISQMPYNVGINSNTQPQFGGMVSVDPDFYRTAGFNPDAQLQQPVGGYGGNPPPVNTPFPTIPFPQQPTMPQPQPNTFANRLKDFGNIYADYIIGRSNAGKASFDPSSGDEAFVNNSGLANAMNQYKNREALKTLQGQQAFDNQIAMQNSISNQEYKNALIKNLTKPEKPKIQSLQGGVFSQVEYPDGKIEILRNDEVADFVEEQNKIKQQAKTGGLTKTQIKRDELFLKDYNPAKFAQSQKNIALLETAYNDVDPTDDFIATGNPYQKLDSNLADTFARFFGSGERREDIEQRVRAVTQESLRALLGGQFAEREGERIIRNAFNPALPERFNRARLKVTIDTLKRIEAEQRARIEYFDKNQTLAGYKNANINLEQVMSDVDKAYEQTEIYKEEQDFLKNTEKRSNELIKKYE